MTACPHGMPTPASCLTCMEDAGLGAAPIPPVTILRTFEARYPGRCRECDEAIHVGDQIAVMSDDTYRHERCAS